MATIRISSKAKKVLDKLKIIPRESYDSVILRVLEERFKNG
jgi:predicted CopG family antitoxin